MKPNAKDRRVKGRSLLRIKTSPAEWEAEQKVVINSTTVTLHFRYPYEIDLSCINTEADLLAWTLHLCGKSWMNRLALKYFIRKVGKHKGFKIYGH
jgi:hypothetical protein